MPATRTITTDDAVVLRPAREADARALARLAVLDSAAPVGDDALLAERGGAIVAALDLASGRAIADPFHPTTDLLALLRTRADALCRSVPHRERRARRSLRGVLAHQR
ncbi:MAG: hypothetical protein MUC84_00590 [Solirubrobacteraceae bacterium]|jgi:hypothetical protein|nr:hypothetical protein [Solirubrobacteraceae bacterium]